MKEFNDKQRAVLQRLADFVLGMQNESEGETFDKGFEEGLQAGKVEQRDIEDILNFDKIEED